MTYSEDTKSIAEKRHENKTKHTTRKHDIFERGKNMERYAILNVGQTYRNRNGSDYICKQGGSDGTILERTTDRWTLTAHGITLYDDGTIEWDSSTGGHWLHGEPERTAMQTPFTPEQEKRIAEIVRATLSEGREAVHTASRGAFEDMQREDQERQGEQVDPVRDYFERCYKAVANDHPLPDPQPSNQPATSVRQADTSQESKTATSPHHHLIVHVRQVASSRSANRCPLQAGCQFPRSCKLRKN